MDAHAKTRDSARRYELSFRSRDSDWFGHNYVVVRRIEAGRIVESRLVGFGPDPKASDLEALVGTAGWVGAEPGDKHSPATRDYTVRIGRKEYDSVVRTISALKRDTPDFELLGTNCNTFVGAVARAASIATPANEAMLPEVYIDTMRELNAPVRRARPTGEDARGGKRVQREASAGRPFHSAEIYDWDAPR